MNKQIDLLGYNQVTIKKRYVNGDCLCDVELVETIEEVETVKASDTNLIFTSKQLALTDEEIDVLNTVPTIKDLGDESRQ